MALTKILTVLFIANCVCAHVLIKRKCSNYHGAEAVNCSRHIVQDFLQEFSGGIPDLGIKAVDPIYLDQIEVADDALGFKSIFPSLRVTGFRNVVLGDLSEKNDTDALRYTLKFDFVAEGFISIDFPEKKKVFTGDVKYTGGALASVTHLYTTRTVNDGILVGHRQEPGPEQILCQSLHAESEIDDDLTSALHTDPDVQAVQEQWLKTQKDHEAKVVCTIAEAVFKVGINNIRAFVRADLIR